MWQDESIKESNKIYNYMLLLQHISQILIIHVFYITMYFNGSPFYIITICFFIDFHLYLCFMLYA
jgi:hypothetical protein